MAEKLLRNDPSIIRELERNNLSIDDVDWEEISAAVLSVYDKAIDTLNDREKIIINLRKFREKSITLDELGQKLKISKERVRQIETKALEKLKKSLLEISHQNKEFFI